VKVPDPRIGSLLALTVSVLLSAVTIAGARPHARMTVPVVTFSTSGPPPNLEIGCPSPPGAVHGIQVWIHVTQWCSLAGVRDQAQFKLQMEIYNPSKYNLEIGPEHVRLIVAQLNLSKWSPPRSGPATTERPFRTTYLHQSVWAIPANANDAYDPIPHVPGDLTFATHWEESLLSPGRTFVPAKHLGDIVYYIPYLSDDPKGIQTSADVLGVAYMYGRTIVVLCPKGHWGPKRPAGNF
jgi:hypothetical protein